MKLADLVSRSTITHMESCPFCVLGNPTTKSIPISSYFQTGGPGGSVAVRGVGEKGEGTTGSRFPAAARAEVPRGSLATAAGGDGRRRQWRRRCKARRR